MPCLPRSLTPWALALLLAACGGGGGDAPAPSPAPTPAPTPQGSPSLAPACSGTYCGAQDQRYSGSGVGLWSYTNTTAQNTLLSADLQQLPQRPLLLVYSNTGANAVALPALRLERSATPARASQRQTESRPENLIPDMVRHFHPRPAPQGAVPAPRAAQSAPLAQLGSERSWYISPLDGQFLSRNTTLVRQRNTADGRSVRLWLEDGEAGSAKITPALLDALLDRFVRPGNGAYAMVTQLAGQPWGAQPRSDMIGPEQPIDIVLANLQPDGQAYGLMGYFWGLNNMRADPADSQLRYSNQALSFYLDTETLYLDAKDGLDAQTSTLAHELLHMVNFYQRELLMGSSYRFDTALDEMVALMMEDLLSDQLTPGKNPARDSLVPRWLQSGDFNCNVRQWSDSGNRCFGYNVEGSFGAYLLRQHGAGFYQQLLQSRSSTDSSTLLDQAITQAGGPGLAGSLARWGSSIALLPAAATPQGFGYPQRQDASGHLLPAIAGPALASARQLPSQVPATLVGYGHFPFTRQPDAQGRYQEQLSVPPGVSLTVVAQ